MYEDAIFELNPRRKRINSMLTILVLVMVVAFGFTFFMLFRNSVVLEDSIISQFVSHVKTKLAGFNLHGVFYVALFGGLFFLFFPMEAYFMKALGNNNPYLVLCIFIFGIIISYSLDYLIGMKLSRISKKLISPKKFYNVKSYINRFGNIAILIANGVPFLPSQQVTFILGVFRYNKLRLFVLTVGGQILKALTLMGVYFLIFG